MGLIDILKALKRGKESVKLCPRCETPSLKSSSWMDGWLTPQVYICTRCGYRGPIYLEVAPEGEGGGERSSKEASSKEASTQADGAGKAS